MNPDPYKRYSCPCCPEKRSDYLSMTRHFGTKHRSGERLASVYFDQGLHPRLFRKCRACAKPIRGSVAHIPQSGRRTCGPACNVAYRVSLKQSPEIVARRIASTDQKAKEARRQATMLSRYGQLSTTLDREKTFAKMSLASKGRKHSKEQHAKCIQSKIRNGTLLHSQKTKDLVSRKLRAYYQNPANLALHSGRATANPGRGHDAGWYRGLYCRSSYEKRFLDFCYEFGIEVTAPLPVHVIQYTDNDGKLRRYFPDFYLPKIGDGTLIEIKPLTLYAFGNNLNKYNAAMLRYPTVVLTDEDGLLDPTAWERMYTDLTGKRPFLV